MSVLENTPLPASASSWDCVKDNVTGLIWEVKTGDSGLHSISNSYTWYEPDNSRNGGIAGTQNGGRCIDSACDTFGYVQAVNAQGLCGSSNWRMPTVEELMGILRLDDEHCAVDREYFPNVCGHNRFFWTSTVFTEESAMIISPDSGLNLFQTIHKYYARFYRYDKLKWDYYGYFSVMLAVDNK